MRLKPPRWLFSAIILILSIIASGSVIGPVHAAGPSLVQSGQCSFLSATSMTCGWNSSVTTGDLLVIHTVCWGPPGAGTAADQGGSTWIRVVTAGGSNPPQISVWYAFSKSGGNNAITVTWSNCSVAGSNVPEFSLEEFSGVGAIGNTVTTGLNQVTCNSSCTDTQSISVTVNNALVYETFDVFNIASASNCPTFTNGASQITSQTLACTNNSPAGVYDQGRTLYNPNRGIGVNSFSMQASALGASNSNGVLHTLLELDPPGGAPSNLGTQTACFGNCGNPAVTLANTNSTHTVAFNQTITLLYSFQSQLNGQVLNMTTSLAKSYSNGQTMTMGVYTVPVCPPGITPFSPPCPGILQTQTTFNLPAKGRTSINNLAVPVSAGQWVGIAVTALYTGLDLNDTNTQVVMLQASGSMPASISQTTTFSATSKVALWAYITGNIVTGTPPPTTVGGFCFGLDCILTNAVNSLCTVVSNACQTASSMFLAIILTIISILILAYFFSQILPTVNIGRLGLGEIGILIFVMWIAIFTSFSLMSLYVLAITFSIIAIMMGKRVSGYI